MIHTSIKTVKKSGIKHIKRFTGRPISKASYVESVFQNMLKFGYVQSHLETS